MSGFFYRLGRLAGPSIRKGKWIWHSLAGTEDEIIQAEQEVGRDLAQAFRREMELEDDEEIRTFVNELGTNLAGQLRDKRRTFAFSVVVTGAPNAFALPGGYIFVTRSLLDFLQRDRDRIAFVLAHEIGHVIRQDPMQRTVTDTTIAAAVRAMPGAGVARGWLKSVGARALQSAYSQDREFGADELGVRLSRAAGFDPYAAIHMLERIGQLTAAKEGEPLAPYFSTHPPVADRIRELRRFLQAG